MSSINLKFYPRYQNEDGEWETDDQISGVEVDVIGDEVYIEVFDWMGNTPLNACGYLDREHAEKLRDFLNEVLK